MEDAQLLLLTGDQGYVDVLRRQLDNIYAQKKVVDGKVLLPKMYGDPRGYKHNGPPQWYEYTGDLYQDRLTEIYLWSMKRSDLERVPKHFTAAVENCAFIVEHDPPGGRRNLLGLYHGVSLPNRGHYSGAMPDTITIYQNPIIRVFRTRERVREEVYRTVVHEIGHYFGMDDEELHGLGW